MNIPMLFPILTSLIILLFGIFLLANLKKQSIESNRASEISILISEGLNTFLKRMINSITQVIIYLILAFVIFAILFNKNFYANQILAFIAGSVLMCLCFVLSLKIIERVLPRILKLTKSYVEEVLLIVLDSSSAISFIIIGIMILGFNLCYLILGINSLIGYGVGIILTSYIFRISGGLYKSAADIGSDLISTIEKDIPYFDPRNPITLLDIIGDWISKVLGFCSDIFSSFMLTIIASIIFSYFLLNSGYIDQSIAMKLQQLTIFIISLGFIVSLFIYFFAKHRIKTNFHNVLLESVYLSVIISAIGTFFIIELLDLKISSLPAFLNIGGHFILFVPYLIGLFGAVLISYTAEILTSARYSIAKQTAKETEFGAVISIFNSLAISFKSVFLFVAYILIIIIPSIYCAGFYGVLFASLGMLSVTGTILIINIFSPLILNTTKIIRLVNEDNIALKNVIKMERLAQTTIALGNGFLTGVSVLSSFNIFFAMLLIMGQKTNFMNLFLIDLKLLSGLIIGIALPLVFLGLLLSGLTKIILSVLKEGYRQFRDIPYLDQDKARPDIIKASDQTTQKAMNALILPTALMLLVPIIIGYVFSIGGFKILLGMLLGTILISLTLGFAWSLIGEGLNNAKNYIGKGHFGGSTSSNFINIRIADNFGDAFKDLLSPSLNLFVKTFAILNILIIVFLI